MRFDRDGFTRVAQAYNQAITEWVESARARGMANGI